MATYKSPSPNQKVRGYFFNNIKTIMKNNIKKHLDPVQIKYRQWLKDNKKKNKHLYELKKDKYNKK
jgi:hypothetical protein